MTELFRSRLSVLVGPAGTGKTTLLKALADLPAVSNKGVVLLAPTGKASVQMSTKWVDRRGPWLPFWSRNGAMTPTGTSTVGGR